MIIVNRIKEGIGKGTDPLPPKNKNVGTMKNKSKCRMKKRVNIIIYKRVQQYLRIIRKNYQHTIR